MASGLRSMQIARIQVVLEDKWIELQELVDNCDDATKLEKLQHELERVDGARRDFGNLDW